MKRLLIILILLSVLLSSEGQKRQLDTVAFTHWPEVGDGMISPDGLFTVFYIFENGPVTQTLHIQPFAGGWDKQFKNASNALFSQDSKELIFQIGSDSVCILSLITQNVEFIPNATDYKLASNSEQSWLVYRVRNSAKSVIIHSLDIKPDYILDSVRDYEIYNSGRLLLVNIEHLINDRSEPIVKSIELADNKEQIIWEGTNGLEQVKNYSFDHIGEQIAFIVSSGEGENTVNTLWYYRSGMGRAKRLVRDSLNGISGMVVRNGPIEFSEDDKYIYFDLQNAFPEKKQSTEPNVDIWSYVDTVLHNVQLNQHNYFRNYRAVVNISKGTVLRLEQENQRIVFHAGGYALLRYGQEFFGEFESYWNRLARNSFFIVSISDGSVKSLRQDLESRNSFVELSPLGKWVVYYDMPSKNYYSYEVATGITRNLTQYIHTVWTSGDEEYPLVSLIKRIKWLGKDEAFLVEDNYDIWQLDPKNKQNGVCITNAYGGRSQIKFDIFYKDRNISKYIDSNSTLLLRAFNIRNKDMGFYSAKIGRRHTLRQLYMGPYIFGQLSQDFRSLEPPIKAKESDTYMVFKMSATKAPNYFKTTDFSKFDVVSNISPQAEYYWLTTELFKWRTFDGRLNYGILYKPEHFDSSKKYPVIFDIYESRSDELNLFIKPDFSRGRINIPWFVSRGYIVCTPDIHYRIGDPGLSAYNSVVAAAKYLAKKPWTDERHFGLQGHSFGGYEANYIITRTNIFAAVCAASGVSDLISMYGALHNAGGFPQYHEETQQGRMGLPPWKMSKKYVSNSPVLYADKITTPLLLMSNKGDIAVPFTQGVELFIALRRLGKVVWLLQYDRNGHALETYQARTDFTIRLDQFFDYYLKDAPAPIWMTTSIPASKKGIENGYEYNSKGIAPPKGLNLH